MKGYNCFLPHVESYQSFFKTGNSESSRLHEILSEYFPLTFELEQKEIKSEELDDDLRDALEKSRAIQSFDQNKLKIKKYLTMNYIGYKITKSGLDEYNALRYFETINSILTISISYENMEVCFYEGQEIYSKSLNESQYQVKIIVPEMNIRGSFIIRGIERVPIAQLLPKNPKEEVDDPNHLKNKVLLLVGDHLEKYIKKGLNELKKSFERDIKKSDDELFTKRFSNYFSSIIEDALNEYFTSELCQILDQTNPLSELSHKRKITSYGPGGISKEYRGIERRDVHYSQYGRICPVETPESIKIGLTTHFATHAQVRDKQIVSPIKCPDGEIRYLTAEEEESLSIAPFRFQEEPILYVRRGSNEMSQFGTKTDNLYTDCYPEQMIGIGASLIPFIQHDDANRVLMGAKNLKQALPLKHPEQPLVKTGIESLAVQISKRALYAENDGIVTSTDNDVITIRQEDFSEKKYILTPPTPSIHGTTIYQKPIVTVGDQVRKGQCIAEGSCIKNGELALGVNLLVAYMPWYGYNFEDAIVISDRLVKEDILTSLHMKELIFDVEDDEIVTKIEGKTNDDEVFSLESIGEDGIIKIGQIVEPGDHLIFKYRIYKDKNQLKKGEQPIKIFDLKCLPRPIIVRADDDTFGTVVYSNKIKIEGKEKIVIWLQYERKVTVGDKLMGRHGNKGVISKIIPQDQMPRLQDGTPIDVILNPHGVISRMNLGQLLETHLGLKIKQTGRESVIVKPFEPFDIERLKEELELLGFPEGKAILFDANNKPISDLPVTVGWQYIVKLNHIAEEKEHARLTDRYSTITQQAPRGKKNNGGQRIGEMEEWALIAHGAYKLLEEFTSFKADDVVSRKDLMQTLSRFNFKMPNMFSPKRTIPESFRVFLVLLKGLGAKPTLLLNDGSEVSDFDFLPSYEIKDLKGLKIMIDDTTKTINDTDIIDESGLFKVREYEELSCGCRGFFEDILYKKNPYICKNHTKVLLTCGCKGSLSDISILSGKNIKCKNCNKDVEIRHVLVTLECGCDGVLSKSEKGKYRCSKHNRDVKAQDNIKILWSEEKEIPVGICSDKIFTNDKEKGRRQKFGYIALAEEIPHPLDETKKIKYLPVIPPELRPMFSDFYWGSDLNYLYNQVIIHNNRLKKLLQESQSSQISVEIVEKARARLIKSLKALMIDGDTRDGKYYRSILDMLNGKEGLFRQAMLGKRIDFSARAVIVPAPDIRLDEVNLPFKIAKVLFSPWIKDALKEHENISSADINHLLHSNLNKAQKDRVISAINNFIITNNIVVVLNRAPSLHRYNFLAFKPIVKDQPVIGLHPLVCNGFNADFDGDQMGVYLPLIAQKEARELLDPYRHVLSIANGEQILHFSQDIVAGLYLEGISKKQIKEEIKSKYSKLQRADFINYVQELMQRGFNNITKKGLTISLFDFDNLMVKKVDREKIFSELVHTHTNDSENLYEKWKTKVKETIESNVKAEPTNPVSILCTSGARGDINTLTQLAGMRGMMQGSFGTTEPVRSNFREGLNVLEFFVSTYGSRSSLADKKLTVAVAGDLTRRLIYSAMDILITEDDCGSDEGIILHRRLYGRYALEDLEEAGIKKGMMITKMMEDKLGKLNRGLLVRSPITCKAEYGICKKCYGIDLSTCKEPERCLAVGVIAAESIGERGTQLSMRTFHTGGVKDTGQNVGLSKVKGLFEGKDWYESLDIRNLSYQEQLNTIVNYFLDSMSKEYKNAIDDIHFEIILKSMLKVDGDRGYEVRGITKVAQSKPDFLARVAFQRAKMEIKNAICKGQHSTFDTIQSGLLLGGNLENFLRRCRDV